MKNKLSQKQMLVYIRMDYDWKSAYELKAGLDILDAIVRKGYAEKKIGLGGYFFPRTETKYRKTDKPIG